VQSTAQGGEPPTFLRNPVVEQSSLQDEAKGQNRKNFFPFNKRKKLAPNQNVKFFLFCFRQQAEVGGIG